MNQAKSIDLNDYGSTLVLRCPRCGGDTLHHLSVRVFDRAENQETVVETTVEGHLVNQREVGSKKPATQQ